MKEYWLFVLVYDDGKYLNVFMDSFPTKQYLLELCDGEDFAIVHTMRLTEEQYNKLTKK